jgi:serine/threonine protein kinase
VYTFPYHPVNLQYLIDGLDKNIQYRTALYLFNGIVEGVSALHNAEVAHGDLEPRNILLNP